MMIKILKKYWITALIAVIFITIWQFLTTKTTLLNPVIFPDVGSILAVFRTAGLELVKGFISSMNLLIPAYVLSIILGVMGGLIFGLNQTIRRILMPYVNLLSPLPPTLFIPYAIALLPTFSSASIFLIFLGAFWPIFMGTLQGVLLIDQAYLDNARILRLKRSDFIGRVALPAASPLILNGASQSLTLSFLVLTMAEMFGANSGMGYFIQYYADFSLYDHVIAGMLFTSSIILIVLFLFDKLKKRILFWTNLNAESD